MGIQEAIAKIVKGLTADQKREFVIKDNATFGEWDMDALANGWGDLPLAEWGVPLSEDWMVGGKDAEIADAEPQIDRAEELNKTWNVKTGDLWQIGSHRLLCGDCTKAEDVARVMVGEKAVLMNTDPPYGVNYGGLVKSREYASKKPAIHHKKIKNDELDAGKLQEFLEKAIKSALPHLIENPAFYLWHPMLTQGTFFAAAAAADILIHRQIVWVKPSLILGRGDYHWRHELCFYGWIRGKRCAWHQGRDQDTVWAVGRESNGNHPTQKPVELFLRPIKNHTKPEDAVYEPFAGSGPQYVAAENEGRFCYGLEIEPSYCAVILQRMTDAFPGIEIKRIKP